MVKLETLEEIKKSFSKEELEEFESIFSHPDINKKTYLASLSSARKIENERDPLTGAYNRRKFDGKLSQEFNKRESKLSILLFDIDDFKLINDNFGHDGGDLALKKVTETVTSCLRKNDSLYRNGGDEYAVILENTTINEAYNIAERIRKNISSIVIGAGKKKKNLSASIGITQKAHKNSKIKSMVKDADIALYKSKELGKNKATKYVSKENYIKEIDDKVIDFDFKQYNQLKAIND